VPATIKALATTLLAALGDPRATSGTVGSLTYRLTHFIQDCGVELLILDELQHFRDRDNRKVLENASNWLKTLIKETGVACVLVGLQGEAEEVVQLNAQLARLFGAPHVLAPFAWDERRSETIHEFLAFLTLLEGALPLAERPELATPGMAARLHAASGGIMAYLMELIRRATYLALAQERPTVDSPLPLLSGEGFILCSDGCEEEALLELGRAVIMDEFALFPLSGAPAAPLGLVIAGNTLAHATNQNAIQPDTTAPSSVR